MGNSFAYIALFSWPLLVLYFVKTKPTPKAIVLAILGGFLFLPVKTNVDLPLLPAFDKATIPIITLLAISLFSKTIRFKVFSNCKISNLLILMIVVTPIFSMLNNQEPMISGARYIRGLTYHEALSYSMYQFLFIGAFFLGRRYFRTVEDQYLLFKMIVMFALLYSLFILVELRLSPQLHSWVYGFFPHSYIQALRDGGYRPIVFLGHGLMVSFFIAAAVISASVLWKSKINIKADIVNSIKGRSAAFYLVVILFLSKSLAPFLYAIFSAGCSVVFSAKRIMLIAMAIGFVALSYPASKMLGVFPDQQIISFAKEFAGDERALSLQVRFDNEDILLDKAKQKLMFGWGGWGRSRVFDEHGEDISITDGFWAIEFGSSGMIGFIGMFGLMFLSIYKARKAFKMTTDLKEKNTLALHALFVAIILIDQLPNSSLATFWWLVIGALMGRSEELIKLDLEQKKQLKAEEKALSGT